jgi:protein-disulfide isomerase/uncharacterized membrane protein
MPLRVRFFNLSLIVLGLVISGYLLWHHFTLTANSESNSVDTCSELFGTGCDEALRSPLAIQLGIPLAGWGLIFYGTLASLLVLGWSIGDTFRSVATQGCFLLALAGLLITAVLAGAVLLGRAPFCPLCTVLQVVNVAIVFGLKKLTGRSLRELCREFSAAVKYLFGGAASDPLAARWTMVGFLIPALVAVALYQWVLLEMKIHVQAAESAFDPQQILDAYRASAGHKIPIRVDDPSLGISGAKAHLVVFNDFQCPACRRFLKTMEFLQNTFEGELQIVFKHAPLGTACNDSIKVNLHPQACEAAEAAEAARRQGQFWRYHDALFAADLVKRQPSLESIARDLEMDLAQFESDRQATDTKTRIAEDVALGNRLGVDGTPTVFLNGRRVYDLRRRALAFLVASEITRTVP